MAAFGVLDRHLAGPVLGDGERHRPRRVEPDRVRRQPCSCCTRTGRHSSHQVLSPVIPETESAATYWYYAIALFGAAMTPYEVFFFSSGAVEEHWTVKDLGTSRLNVLVGFPLGGVLSVAIAAGAAMSCCPPDRGDLAVSGGHAGRCGRRQTGVGFCRCRHHRRHLRRSPGNHPVVRLYPRPVLRLDMGQVPAAG